MNRKLVLGFAAGVLAASGISYLITHRKPAAPSVNPVPAAQVAEVAVPPALSQPEPAAPPEPRKKQVVRVAKGSAKAAVMPPPAETAQTSSPTVASPAPAPNPAVVPDPAPPLGESRAVAPPPPPRPEPLPAPVPSTIRIPPGTLLAVRLGEGMSSERNQAGDEFTGSLDQPLVIDNLVIAERGARVEGRVVEAAQAGRVRGLARLSLELTKLHTSDGQRVAIHTVAFVKQGPESKQEDAAKIGIGAALGAIIGAAAGGGKGAAIGAATGGAAGGGAVAVTRGKPAVLPVETVVSFRTAEPVTLTERLN